MFLRSVLISAECVGANAPPFSESERERAEAPHIDGFTGHENVCQSEYNSTEGQSGLVSIEAGEFGDSFFNDSG